MKDDFLRNMSKNARKAQRRFFKSFDEKPKEIALQYLHEFQNVRRQYGNSRSSENLYELTITQVVKERFADADFGAHLDNSYSGALPSAEFVQSIIEYAKLHPDYYRTPFRIIVAVALIQHKSLARGGAITGWGAERLKMMLVSVAETYIPPDI